MRAKPAIPMRLLCAAGFLLCCRYTGGCRVKLNSYGPRIISPANETAMESIRECPFVQVDCRSRTPPAGAPARCAQRCREPLLASGVAGPAPRRGRGGEVRALTPHGLIARQKPPQFGARRPC